MSKRLGAMKTTMFAIGGVTQLKQHAFFAGIDFNALLRKDVTPPIEVSSKNGVAGDASNFHEEFTAQQVSQVHTSSLFIVAG